MGTVRVIPIARSSCRFESHSLLQLLSFFPSTEISGSSNITLRPGRILLWECLTIVLNSDGDGDLSVAALATAHALPCSTIYHGIKVVVALEHSAGIKMGYIQPASANKEMLTDRRSQASTGGRDSAGHWAALSRILSGGGGPCQ